MTTFNRNVWLTDSQPLRGCALCDYGRDLATVPPQDGLLCRHPAVSRPTTRVPTVEARRRGGACGPEADHLTIGGMQL